MIKNKVTGAIASLIAVIGVSCNNVPGSPGWEYMPDMYRSSSYETNSGNGIFADSLSNRQPVAGTISQGWLANSEYSMLHMPYPYKNDSAGYEDAGKNIRNPLPATEEVLAQGKDKFEKFCMHCHGATGQGDGSVVSAGNFPPPPAYTSPQLKNLPEGKMFHTLQYGKGMMGSHASQLTIEERWKILRYVQTLQNPGGTAAAPAAAPADSAKQAPAVVAAAHEPAKTDSTDNK